MVADASTTTAPVITPNDMNILDKAVVDNELVITVAAGKKVEKSGEYTVTYYEWVLLQLRKSL